MARIAGPILFSLILASVTTVAVLSHLRPQWRYSRVAPLLALTWASVVGLGLFTTGWLMRPDLPPPPWVVSWGGAGEATFGGTVLNGGVGNVRIPPGPTMQGELAAALLRRGALFGVFVRMGERTAGMAPLIALHDAAGREVALLGVDGADLVYRGRTRASSWGFRDPVIRAPGMLETLHPGDSARIATLYTPLGRCFDAATLRRCRVGLTGGSGWALLHDLRLGEARSYAVADGVWLALLIIPVGFWAGPKLAGLIFIALAWYGVFRLPVDAPVLPLTGIALTGLAVGLLVGMALQELSRRREPILQPERGDAEPVYPAPAD
jgi:hypothetical protein